MQPWDRDNCKLLNVWLMVAAGFSGALLAAPFEFLLGHAIGVARVANLTGSSLRAVSAAASPRASPADRRAARSPLGFTASAALAAGAALAFLLCSATGMMMIRREFSQYHVLLDQDQINVGEWISTNLAPKANILHKDVHITPSGTLAGRTALISYNGWMWSHGYNYGDRDRDRQYVLGNCLKDHDQEAVNAMKRWGVRYVLCEWCQKHSRAPNGDPDMYLNGNLKRIYSRGRYDVLEVCGVGAGEAAG